MKPVVPSFTAEWHDDTYDAINPHRPEPSQTGARVIVTGGGIGLGRHFARAFADAGAASIAVLGRRANHLESTKKEIEAVTDAKVTVFPVDITGLDAVKRVAQEFGTWDVLISNVGYFPGVAHIAKADPTEWWRTFEVNVKGTFNVIQAFMPTRGSNAKLISLNASLCHLPFEFHPGNSAYAVSKLALLKLSEAVINETPDLHVVNLHPGVVETEMMEKFVAADAVKWENKPQSDQPALSAHFAVWLCSEEAKFLKGRFVCANWDVPQLIAKKAEIEANPALMTVNIVGWPYVP